MGDKLALVLIGDLVKDGGDAYWESQGSLAKRMGATPRSAGRAVRSLTKAGVLTFDHWMRVGSGATVKVFDYTPENIGREVGETFQPDISDSFAPELDRNHEQVGRTTLSRRKFLATASEETVRQVGSGVLQTGREPEEETQKENRDKLAIRRSRIPPTRRATA